MSFSQPLTKNSNINVPGTLARFGESCVWFRYTFDADSDLTKYSWPYTNNETESSFDVTSVSWQLFSSNSVDLDRVLWECSLKWAFTRNATPLEEQIGPLTQSTGSFGDALFPEERDDLQRLADTNINKPSEELWRILTQGSKIGDTFVFQGRKDYHKIPICFPQQTGADIVLSAQNSFCLSAPLRVRVILHGTYRRTIMVT